MITPEAAYLWSQVQSHVARFFVPAARELLRRTRVTFAPYQRAVEEEGSGISIPIDQTAPVEPESPYRVPFSGVELTLWNRLARPRGQGWVAIPREATPLWYQHESGNVVPAWNIFGNLFDLLTLREERESGRRNGHGRFLAAYSPRKKAGLLEVPGFNEAVAALVAACAGLQRDGKPAVELAGLLRPPTVVLSHDCDALRGNDFWTQAVRVYRVFRALLRGRLSEIRNLWWMVINICTPRQYYFDNVRGIVDIEREFGFTSSVYVLNGTGGRFGARSGAGLLPELTAVVPSRWDVGIHYNYDTYLDTARFRAQLDELRGVLGREVTVGRAHYLRFDGEQSLPFLASFGLQCDESAGYPDSIGYRCGIAGCFQAFDVGSRKALDIWEEPLTIMEATIVEQYGDGCVDAFARLLRHISRVGGALSVLVHPGLFHNPEFPEFRGLYHRLLIECRQSGARSMTALALSQAGEG